MKKIVLFAVLLLISLQSLAGTILVLGDSISAAYGIPRESGWVALLADHLNEQQAATHRVVNASVSGETTAGGLSRLPALLSKVKPDLVIIELGGNDGLRAMSLQQMEANLRDMVQLSREQGAGVLLLSVKLPVSYGAHFNDKFKQVFETVAESEKVEHLPLGFDSLSDRNLLQEDGIHPTAEAQPVLFRLVWTKLEPMIG